MERISHFSIEKHEGAYESWPGKSRLFFDNKDTETRIRGYVIEAQYKCKYGYLLITSQDCIFEESNDFVLLDWDFRVAGYNNLLVPYDSFLIQNHWPVSENMLRLHYDSALFFDLSVDEESLQPFPAQLPRLSWLDTLFVKWRGTTPENVIRTQGLVLKQFTDFQNDQKCIASVKHHNEQIEKLKQRLSEARSA